MHLLYTPADRQSELAHGCRTAGIGCLQCKKVLYEEIMADLAPVQARWQELEAHPDDVRDILRTGAARVRPIAQATVAEAKERMGLGKV
jgi:tryptophanyl-tRNA synthetase